jgi:hypothetical protein
MMSQSISGVTAGDKYHITAEFSQPSFSSGSCVFVLRVDAQLLVQRAFAEADVVFCGRFDASGAFESAVTEFTLTYYCYNRGAEPIDVWAAFDNPALFVYPAPATPSFSSSSSAASPNSSPPSSSATNSTTT